VTDAILVRHGATSWTGRRYCGRSDPWLTAEGRAAVEALAAELTAVAGPATQVLASPARRARQTAAAIARLIGSRVEIDDRWRETDFGAVEGLTWERLETRFPALAAVVARGDLVDWPDGERALDLERRVQPAWAELVRRAEPVIVVTHGGPLRVLAGPLPVPEPARWIRIPFLPLAANAPER
jgi:broad specificity phosphatase PhoE